MIKKIVIAAIMHLLYVTTLLIIRHFAGFEFAVIMGIVMILYKTSETHLLIDK